MALTPEKHNSTEPVLSAGNNRTILFVCTGNTCRSPLAESLCKKMLAESLGCATEELPAKGFLVQSAGVAAAPGDAASPNAVLVAEEFGADLRHHRSRPVNPELLQSATDVITMTRTHTAVLTTYFANYGPLPEPLCGPDHDLADPVGRDSDAYRYCADVIIQQLNRLIPGWLPKDH